MYDGELLPLFYGEDVDVEGDGKVSADRQQYWRVLRYNVFKVYPLAVTASKIVNEIDADLANIPDKKKRKEYLKNKEKLLSEKYKKELKDLTINQGKILVKLINRETGKDVYSLIKETRGGVKARVSQTAFYFFDNDLKATYDPQNEDKDIEYIIQEIHAKGLIPR